MIDGYPEPTGMIAEQLAPFQAALTPWVFGVAGLMAAAAVGLAWRRKSTAAALTLLFAALALAVGLDVARDRRVGWEEDSYRRVSTLRADERVTYLPEASRVRLAACGNDNLAADAMWFRSLFFILGTADARGSGELIYHMYDVIQDLNPAWKEPQLLGPVLVSALSGENREMHDNRIELARKLLTRSQQQFPRDFRFYDLEANLYWSASADRAQEQDHARRMIDLYQRIFDRYETLYLLHPEENPYLDYASEPVRRQITAAAAAWWAPRRGDSTLTAEDLDARLDETDRQALQAHWQAFRSRADAEVVKALEDSAVRWREYRESRTDLRTHLLRALNSPDYREELHTRAGAFCGALLAALQNPAMTEQERPEKLFEFLRWEDVFRRTGYEMAIEAFRKQAGRLPTEAEFRMIALTIHSNESGPEGQPVPALPAYPPNDPFGWPYRYQPGADGKSFAVYSHFDAVHRTDLKASRLLTMLDTTRAALGRPPADLQEVQRFMLQKYPPGSPTPAPLLDSFGETRDCEGSPCGGRFELRDNRLYAPADLAAYWRLRKSFGKLPFEEIFKKTRAFGGTGQAPAGPEALAPYP